MQTQFDVLNIMVGRNGMSLDEISDELRWKRGNANHFLMGMYKDGLLTFLNAEEASRRNFKNATLIRYLRLHPFEYLAVTPRGKNLWAKLRNLPYIDEL